MANVMESRPVSRFTARFKVVTAAIVLLLVLGISAGCHCGDATGPALNLSIRWEPVGGPGSGGYIMCCGVSPGNSNVILLGGDVSGMHRTEDGGKTWRDCNRGLASPHNSQDVLDIYDLEIHPGGRRVNIATACGLFTSGDLGDTWSNSLCEGTPFGALTADPSNPSRLWAGTGTWGDPEKEEFAFFQSSDGGESWEELPATGIPPDVEVGDIVAFHGTAGGSVLIVATDTGIFRSTDEGRSFTRLEGGLPHNYGTRLSVTREGGEPTVFLMLYTHPTGGGTSGGVFRLDLGTSSWTDITSDLPLADNPSGEPIQYGALSSHPGDPGIIYAGTEVPDDPSEEYSWDAEGSYRTINGGGHWEYITGDDNLKTRSGEKLEFWDIESMGLQGSFITIDPNNPSVVYTGSDQVLRSVDGGDLWENIYSDVVTPTSLRGRGLHLLFATAAAFDPHNKEKIYLGYDDVFLFTTEDSGETVTIFDTDFYFEKLEPEYLNMVSSIVVDKDNRGVVCVAAHPQYNYRHNPSLPNMVLKSNDGGRSWEIIGNQERGLPDGFLKLLLVPGGPEGVNAVYAASYGGGVFQLNPGDGEWKPLNQGLPESPPVETIACDHDNRSRMMLGLNYDEKISVEKRLYVSSNGGQSWNAVEGAPRGDVLMVSFDPHRSGTAYASFQYYDPDEDTVSGGLYESTDMGDSWRQLNSFANVTALGVHPEREGVPLCGNSPFYSSVGGYDGFGFYISGDGGSTWRINNTGLNNLLFTGVEFSPSDPDTIVVGTLGNGFYLGRIGGREAAHD